MQAIADLELATLNAIAASVTWFADPDAITVGLVKSNFTFNRTNTWADFDQATFAGYAPINNVSAPGVDVAIDPVTGDYLVSVLEPTLGWRWVTDPGVDPLLPQIIYGFYAWIPNVAPKLLGAEKLSSPITLSGPLQLIDIGRVQFRVHQGFFGG